MTGHENLTEIPRSRRIPANAAIRPDDSRNRLPAMGNLTLSLDRPRRQPGDDLVGRDKAED